MTDLCKKCGAEIKSHERACSNCFTDAGFPNVRSAGRAEEQTALGLRFKQAHESAVVRGTTVELDAFRHEAATSRVVMNRSLGALNTWVCGQSPLFLSFHRQVEQLGRPTADSHYDMQRESADSAINPFYYRDITPAALTLDGVGLTQYGAYSVILKNVAIEDRSSVFEENPFEFNQKHHVGGGRRPPFGYRALWSERGTLAAAKLHPKIERGMQPGEFPRVLMEDRRHDPQCDYVEVHIYGWIHRAAIERVAGPKPAKKPDQVLWRQTARALLKLGAIVEEIA
jgi:hypothetical protein